MNQARKRTGTKKVLSMILVLVMLLSLLSMAAFTLPASETGSSGNANEYNIMFLDCGRKYFSVDSIKRIIDNASAAGFNYIQLAVGNDGLRFLLDDMSLNVNGTTYDSDAVKKAVNAGNLKYNQKQNSPSYNPTTNELTETEMNTIITYATSKGMGVIPCVNTPGHMDAILSAANSLTGTTCSYNGSVRTIDVTNGTAVAFTKALLQKYITYFAGKGCKLFNMGADEYANDIYTGGSMGFGQLQSSYRYQYNYYVDYVNAVAKLIKDAKMTPMAFNDGIYYNNDTNGGTFDTDIIVCYWSNGWKGGYTPMSASNLADKGFKLVNTNGSYYWVLGKSDAQCTAAKASGFDKTSFPGDSTIDNPAGSMFCIWSDYPGAETEASVISKTAATISAFGKTVTSGTVTPTPTTPTPDTNTNTKDIYVVVNGTETKTVSGTYNGSYTTDDTNIATVTTKPTTTERKLTAVTSIESGKQYLIVNNRRDENKRGNLLTTQTSKWEGHSGLKLTGEASTTSTELWTIQASGSGYEVMRSGKYLTIGVNTASVQSSSAVLTLSYNTSDGYWNISQNSCYLNNLGNSETAGGWNNSAAPTDDGSKWTIYEITGGEQTTITFNGLAKGTTTVTIGNVKYTINVVDQALADATPLTIEYWITNQIVTADGATSKQIKATDPSVNSESGAKFSDLVPATSRQNGKENVLWKGTRLTSSNKQTTVDGVDQTRAGNDFTYIRYWNQKWSFSVDGKSWTDFNDDDQVVAYYLQKTDVTSEITTNVVDWGQPYSEWKAGGGRWFWGGYVENGSKYVFLDFAVVYEDNTQNPSSFPTDKTLFYHFDGCSETNPRVLGAISFTENSDYEIWKVTVTDGTSTGYSSYSTFAPTYDNTTETTVWDESMGGIPQIDQLKYTANHSGKLVRVYVRAKVTEDSLTVNYFDENNTSLPFYSYNIAVASGTTFSNQFAYVPGNANENGSLSNNTVVNIKGVTQTVNWQLEKMSEIGAQYRFGNYTFTNATKETGNKVVNLYYRFNSEKTFVVDFGLPLHITMTDISPLLNQANVEGVAVGNSLYATVRANDDFSIDYILNKTIDGSDRITVTYTGTKVSGESDSATYNLTIIPATSVYYEDSFAKFAPGTGNASGATWSIVGNDGNVTADQSASQNQTLTELSKMSADEVYGHDAAYADSTKLSMGSARKVTVSANMAKDWTDGSAWPSATFTFKGTGFDIISLTDNTSGTIFVTVTNKTTGQIKKRTTVNNYYGYKLEDGKWVTSPNDPNCLYQIPVIKVAGLDYAEYEVKIQVAYADFLDEAKAGEYSFWLDAIRVYDPMGVNNETYKKDDEGYPQYIKLHDALVKNAAQSQAVFIDGGAEANVDTYKNLGPNNEVYLANGQAITFTVPVDSNIASIQIGAKAPDGRTAQMVVNSGEAKEIQSATEMYYEISKVGNSFTITNTGTGILSLTNLKITFTDKPVSTIALTPLSTEAQTDAVMSVRALFAAPEQTFKPDRFEASWSRNVRKGGTATLTVKASADVESITVDGKTITTYATKTARSFWGSKETYHVFTYRVTNAATADYSICAVNADGVASDPITAKLTVRPSIRDWWNGIFDKWKH